MDSNQDHTVILLRVACISLLIALVLAWCLVFTGELMKIRFFTELFVNRDALLSAHLDFLMMTMLLLGFHATKVPLPAHVCWPMGIGSITNPASFLLAAVGLFNTPVLVFIGISIILTTIGYGMAAIIVLRSTLRR